MNKIEKTKTGAMIVYDAENDKTIEVSPEQQRLANYVHQQAFVGHVITSIAVKKMIDERLYLGLGCQSRDEYYLVYLGVSLTQGKKYLRIGEKFAPFMNPLQLKDLDNINSTKLLKEGQSTDLNPKAENLSNLGLEKLYELTKLEDDEIAELMKKGKVNINDTDIDLEEIKEVTARQMQILIQKATGKYKEEIKKKSAKLSEIEEENKLLKSENKQLVEMNEEAKQIDMKYGAVASKLKDKTIHINVARQKLDDFNDVIFRAGVDADDPETLREDLLDIIRRVDMIYTNLNNVYAEVIADAA